MYRLRITEDKVQIMTSTNRTVSTLWFSNGEDKSVKIETMQKKLDTMNAKNISK